MTYPQAIVIAAALVAGAILLSEGTAATGGGSVAISTSSHGAVTWAARADGAVRSCKSIYNPREYTCEPWILP